MPSPCFVPSPGSVLPGSVRSPSSIAAPSSSLPRARVSAARRPLIRMLGSAAPPPPPSQDGEGGSDAQAQAGEQARAQDAGAPEPARPAAEEAEGADGVEAGEPSTAEDILSSPVFLKKSLELTRKELNETKAKMEKIEAQVDAEKESYVRLSADFDNFRRRSKDEMADAEARVNAKVLKDFLTVLDTFEMASRNVKTETDNEKAINGSYQAINKQMLATFDKMGVEAIETLGEEFDPKFMDAITQQQSTEYEEGRVANQMQRGYKIKDRVIRPAMVVVSAGPGPSNGESKTKDDGASEDAKEESGAAEA